MTSPHDDHHTRHHAPALVSISEQDAARLGGEDSILVRQRRDHAELDAMMKRYAGADTTPAEQSELWRNIVQLVFSHAFAEETVLWPVLRRVSGDGEDLTARVEQEHQEINELIAQVERSPDDPRRPEWIRRSFALISQDVRDEEDELLPRLRDALSDRRLRQIGVAWEAVRVGAPTHPHPVVSRRPPGNVLSGLPLSVYDRLRDLAPADAHAARRATLVTAGAAAAGTGVVLMRRAARRAHRH
ncbi:hemerythrin domain-containing protein [Streptomyces griseorubiginosus]|uniref:hemerythrin domain-containing protein n=1 Tax=Streptomyces griseorubiginosus TaxID=67304 RepID=UPI002E81D6B7|nr:hemerythrin domain-containing protein [Streptomyces griseorubiginosus]WUB49722.1 hemerythrin domain-containing protein [Streptomyces griseorubiginosus]WUB58251.1 hemerythrin domain-containing protein [Streptomyces griseorubiginosus]